MIIPPVIIENARIVPWLPPAVYRKRNTALLPHLFEHFFYIDYILSIIICEISI